MANFIGLCLSLSAGAVGLPLPAVVPNAAIRARTAPLASGLAASQAGPLGNSQAHHANRLRGNPPLYVMAWGQAEAKLMEVLRGLHPGFAETRQSSEMPCLRNAGNDSPSVNSLLDFLELATPPPVQFDRNLAGEYSLEYTETLPKALRNEVDRHFKEGLKDLSVVLSIEHNGAMSTTAVISLVSGQRKVVKLKSQMTQRERTPSFTVSDEDGKNEIIDVSYISDNIIVFRKDTQDHEQLERHLEQKGISRVPFKTEVWRRIERTLSEYPPTAGHTQLWRFGLAYPRMHPPKQKVDAATSSVETSHVLLLGASLCAISIASYFASRERRKIWSPAAEAAELTALDRFSSRLVSLNSKLAIAVATGESNFEASAPPSAPAMEIWIDVREHTDRPADVHRIDLLLTSDMVIDNKIVQAGKTIGKIIDASTPKGQDEGLAAVGSVPWILAESGQADWKMIPAENLIAAARNAGTKVAFSVSREEDVIGFARALELGVDALCIKADASQDIVDAVVSAQSQRRLLAEESREETKEAPSIVVGECRRLHKTAVIADRVCVDLVQMLTEDEGCFVGSSAKLMALVLSEAATSSLVPSRPFRVNAGPVHSYILMGDGCTTKYLCELNAGDEVYVHCSKTGASKSVAVGRLKVEVRPCMIVGLQTPEGSTSQIFLQQAETVRLGSKDGRCVRVTDISDESHTLLLRTTTSGTHIGQAYRGRVVEK